MLPMTKVTKLRHNEYYNMQELFDKLYADSKKGKVFENLMKLIAQPENIKLAYRNIKRNKGSSTSGTDRSTIEDIKSLPTDKYVEMVQRKLKFYQPKPVRRIEIPKPNGKMRPLGIPTIIDRLVQQSILQVLEPICEAKFHERNNGFRPNRSTENAIAQCYRMIQQQNLHFVVDIDIKGFFDNVNHSKLIKQIWAMGIRDKKLICIIKAMLKSPIVMPNGKIEYPEQGTPQGGILSPLLSNIVLNELDWWISSQWETIPTKYKYHLRINKNGLTIKSHIYRALRNTQLKEMYIVRYADDFKIFCRKRSDADKIFVAVKQWLQDRLKLQISEEKSKVINVRKHYSEYLGFKLKAVRKGKKYVVRSHMRDKSKEKVTEQLIKQIKKIQKPKSEKQSVFEICKYNQMVEGIQNYYRFATHISLDCRKIQRVVSIVITNRLKQRINIENAADIKEIPLGSATAYSCNDDYYRSGSIYLANLGDWIVGSDFRINTEDKVFRKANSAQWTYTSTPLFQYGPYFFSFGGYYANSTRQNLFLWTPYLATINNLETSVIKTADKTMKITYTIQEE